MEQSARIYVAGHRGLVGSAICRALAREGYENLLLPERAKLNLLDQQQVREYFAQQRPDYVFLAAAKVGGIQANNSYPAEFIYDNLQIQCNIIDAAYRVGVRRLLFLGSSCIYPKLAPQPMREEYLLTGTLEPTNEPYAIAKIAGIKMCEAYNRQHGTTFLSLMPTNLYGPNDNFDLTSSHVLPALLRKFHEAKIARADSVTIWGSGTPRREFLHVDDLAAASLFVMGLDDASARDTFLAYPTPAFVNVGTGEDLTIAELAEMMREVVGFSGRLVYDAAKPDGTPRKLLDVSRLQKLGWQPRIPLRQGIEGTYRWFVEQQVKGDGL
jgi:GDP-L-fucose synthase